MKDMKRLIIYLQNKDPPSRGL